MAFAVLAAVLPASASASLTLEATAAGLTGSLLTGNKIKAISEGTATVAGGGVTVECNENFLTGELIKNNGTTIEATITAGQFDSNLTATGTHCKSGLGPVAVTLPLTNGNFATKTHWCIRTNTGVDMFTLTGDNCGFGVTLTFILNFTTIFGEVKCAYDRHSAITGNFTTETAGHNAATLWIVTEPEFTGEVGNPGTCPASGRLKIA